ncbi:MAG: TolC family protein [Acidobacteria bacterium]|nr:TolC family protein [Acidobacteriota bacterium]
MNKPTKILFLICAVCFSFAGRLYATDSDGHDSQREIRTLTVQEAVRMALSRSPEVLLAEARALRAREALRESRSVNRLQVYAGTGLAYNNGFPLSIEGSAPSIFQVNASQPFLSKKNSNLIREAEESDKASRFGTESARNELALQTASVYYELHQARKIIELASGRVDAIQKQQKHVETLLDAGKVLPVDVTLIKTAALSARQQLLIAREQAIVAEKEIREWTGLPEEIVIRTVEPQIDGSDLEIPEETLYQKALVKLPAILQAEAEVRAKDFHVQSDRGEYLPQMEIVSEYALLSRANNYADYFSQFKRHNYLIGLSLKVPIFNGSGTSARIAQSRQNASESRIRLQQIKSNLKLEIRRGFSALRIATGAVDLARNDVEAAREVARVNQTLMESGRITTKELEDFRSQLLQKELALLNADQDLFRRKLELLQSAGSMLTAVQ